MQTRNFSANLPVPLAKKIDEVAHRLERSHDWILQQALTDWVDREDHRRQLTIEALEDVDAGRLVDQQSVEAWADSLATDQPLERPR